MIQYILFYETAMSVSSLSCPFHRKEPHGMKGTNVI